MEVLVVLQLCLFFASGSAKLAIFALFQSVCDVLGTKHGR